MIFFSFKELNSTVLNLTFINKYLYLNIYTFKHYALNEKKKETITIIITTINSFLF